MLKVTLSQTSALMQRINKKFGDELTLIASKVRVFPDVRNGIRVERLVLVCNTKEQYKHNEEATGIASSLLGTFIFERKYDGNIQDYEPYRFFEGSFQVVLDTVTIEFFEKP